VIPDEQYCSLREVKLSEHKLVDRSVNESIALPKIAISSGVVRPETHEAMVPNMIYILSVRVAYRN
jgi:hypothetical protein